MPNLSNIRPPRSVVRFQRFDTHANPASAYLPKKRTFRGQDATERAKRFAAAQRAAHGDGEIAASVTVPVDRAPPPIQPTLMPLADQAAPPDRKIHKAKWKKFRHWAGDGEAPD